MKTNLKSTGVHDGKGWKGGLEWLGGLKVAPAITLARVPLITLYHTSPPSFIQIGPKLPKFLTRSGFGVGRESGWGGLNNKHGPDTLCSF